MNLTITGLPCSGKTTIIDILKDKYDFKVFSSGKLYREEATRRNLTCLELNERAKYDTSVDLALDQRMQELGAKYRGQKVIFDSRLAWHFVPESFKVFVTISESELGKRLFNSTRQESEKGKSELEAYNLAVERRNLELQRYKKMYNLDLNDMSNFDLVVSNENRTAEDTAEEIYNKYLAYCKKKRV